MNKDNDFIDMENNEPINDDENIETDEKENNHSVSRTVFEWVQSMVNAIVLVIIVFTFVVRVINVDGDSMMNTLLDGDKVLVTSYSQQYRYGDVVVISRGARLDKVLIKRVIATEGQIVDINTETGKVIVDNVELEETSYTKDGEGTYNLYDMEFPITVPEGKIFVLGDNRAISKDSRNTEVGFIDVNNVIGKAQCVIQPFDRLKMLG